MSLFGAFVKTVVNVACLPVAVVKDVGNAVDPSRPIGSNIKDAMQQIKDDVDDE